MNKYKISRRTVLRGMGAGLGSVAVGLPLLEIMLNNKGNLHSAVHAQGVPEPKQLIVFHWPQGVQHGWGPTAGLWYPQTEGVNWEMTSGLQPMAPYRADFNVVSGLGYASYASHDPSTGSHGHCAALFTGYKPGVNTGVEPMARGLSVDKIASQKLQGGSAIPDLWISANAQTNDYGGGWWSWVPDGQKFKPGTKLTNPADIYTRLFSNFDPSAPVDTSAIDRDRSVLDFVLADIGDLQKKLSASDRQTIDSHFTQIRQLETTLASPSISAACSKPAQPTLSGYQDDSNADAYTELMIDLAVMALRCDRTRVLLMSLGDSQNYRTLPNKGISMNLHEVVHGSAPLDQRKPLYDQFTQWHMERLAHMFAQLVAKDSAGKSLLDSSAFVALSEFSSGENHHPQVLPVIVAGKAGKDTQSAMKTGSHIAFQCPAPGAGKEFEVSNWCINKSPPVGLINSLWQTALVGLGVYGESDRFGDPALNPQTLSGLWV